MSERICVADVCIGMRFYACGRKAKVERDGKWYCGLHDPQRPPTPAQLRAQARRRQAQRVRESDALAHEIARTSAVGEAPSEEMLRSYRQAMEAAGRWNLKEQL